MTSTTLSQKTVTVAPRIEDRKLRGIFSKVEARERLSYEDGVTLYRTSDILTLGYMANLVRERLHGDVTYFTSTATSIPTDVCVASCRLCAFGKQARDPNSYTMSMEQVWEVAARVMPKQSLNFISLVACTRN